MPKTRYTIRPLDDPDTRLWQVTDTQTGISCTFEEGRFTTNRRFTTPTVPTTPEAAANTVAELVEWINRKHYGIAHFQTSLIKAQARREMADRLRALRKEKGYTRDELAAQVGVSGGFVSRLESGNYGMTIDSVSVLARLLGTRLALVKDNEIIIPRADSPDSSDPRHDNDHLPDKGLNRVSAKRENLSNRDEAEADISKQAEADIPKDPPDDSMRHLLAGF